MYAGTSHSMALQAKLKLMLKRKYVKAWRDGDKWIEIRKVTDVGPSFEVGWIIELEWLGLCRVKEVVWFLCKRDFLAAVWCVFITAVLITKLFGLFPNLSPSPR